MVDPEMIVDAAAAAVVVVVVGRWRGQAW